MYDGESAIPDQSVLARLEPLTSRLDEQAGTIAAQQARIAQLEGALQRHPEDVPARAIPAGAGSSTTSRRGLARRLFGVAVAATLLAVAKEPATAFAYGRGTTLGLGGSTANYGFVGTSGTSDPLTRLPPLGAQAFGLVGSSSAAAPSPAFSSAVAGFANEHGGLMGLSNSNVGVYGHSSSHTGVFGVSESNAGVYGQSQTHIGVYGLSTVTGVVGVGTSNSGVQGSSTYGPGVYCESSTNAGLYATSGYTGVFGTSAGIGVWGATSSGTAIFGQAGGGGWAGHFAGNVYINGSLTVTGSFPKSAAVAHPDGSYRRMYCQEAPEPYFEDFGRAPLVNGQATIALDRDFAAVVNADDYLVFLTELGDSGGLYVVNQTPTSFTVQARAVGPKDAGFAYRLVSRRKDLPSGRMERVQLLQPLQARQAPRALNVNERPQPVMVNGPDTPR